MAFQSRKKFCFFKENSITEVDYKDVSLLKDFITENGKLIFDFYGHENVSKFLPKLVRAIKQARNIALMPYTNISTEG